jgi:tetratricopeptide (TPR) repeat protein
MGIQVIDEFPYKEGSFLDADIYDLSWTAYYMLEVYGRPSVIGIVGKIDPVLISLVEESGEYLHAVLYNKEIAIGILLGYYVLLKTKHYDARTIQSQLSKVLGIVKNYVDEYGVYGEVLYVLKKLGQVADVVRRYIDVDSRIRTSFNNLKDMLARSNLRIEHVEDLFYIAWIICEHKMRDIVDEQELIKLFLDDRLYNLAIMDFRSSAVYANAVASFALRYKFKEFHKILYGRMEELYKALRYYDENLAKMDNGVSGALVSKIRLGIHNLNKALRKLEELNEAQKVRKRYGIPLAVSLLLMAVLLWALLRMPSTLDFVNAYGDLLAWALVSASISLFADIFGGGRVSKAIKWLLEFIRNFIKHWIQP